jgi:hypothetical protein
VISRAELGGATGIVAATQHAACVALARLRIPASYNRSCAVQASHRCCLAELEVESSDLARATSPAAAAAVTAEIHRLVPRFGAALTQELRDGWTVRLRPRGHRLAVETPLPRSLSATVPLARMRAVGLTVELGVRTDGGRAVLDLATAPHLFIGGSNRSGKTALARGILATLARHNDPADLTLAVLDPKARLCHGPLLSLPHMAFAPATRPDDITAALAWLSQQVDTRAALQPREVEALPRVVAFIDEAWAVLASHTHEMVRRAREYGVHLVVVSQVVSARDLDPRATAQLTERIVGRVAPGDWRTSRAIVGDPAALGLGGPGDMFSASLGRFQGAYCAAEDPWWYGNGWKGANVAPAPLAAALAGPLPTINATQPTGSMPDPIRSWLLLSSAPDGAGGVRLPGRTAIVQKTKALTGTGPNSSVAAEWQRMVAAELAPALQEGPS